MEQDKNISVKSGNECKSSDISSSPYFPQKKEEKQVKMGYKISHNKGNHSKAGTILFIVLLLMIATFALLYITNHLIPTSVNAVSQAYSKAKEDSFGKAYGESYNFSYEVAESQHHVSNHISISLGNVREIQRLEVLNVSEVNYQAPPPREDSFWDIVAFWDDDIESWLEVPGTGVFTVNLKASEFIVDPIQQHVIIRLPNPELTSFTIDYNNVQLLNFEEGGIFKDSAKVGVDTAIAQLQDAQLSMRQDVNNNQDFYKRAQLSAKSILTNIIRQLNPDLPNLRVDVEFYN